MLNETLANLFDNNMWHETLAKLFDNKKPHSEITVNH